MRTAMTDDQFIIHVLKNPTHDHELQMVLLEKRIGKKEKSLEGNELREDLNLRFERLPMQSKSGNESRANEEQSLIIAHFKGECRNCGLIGHKYVHCKARRYHGNRQSDVNPQPPYCVYYRKPVMLKSIASYKTEEIRLMERAITL
jgi:hypothetical protein